MNDQNQLQWGTVDHSGGELFLNLRGGRSLAEAVEEALNVGPLKPQQSTVGVRSLSVCALSLGTRSPEVSDSEEEIKGKDLVFVEVDAARQQKAKSESPSATTFDLKNKIAKECLQCHAKLPSMKSAREGSY